MTRQSLDEAIRAMAIRAEKLPPHKQAQLYETVTTKPGIDPETIDWLILMHEHSDDDGNITNQTLRNIVNNATAAERGAP